MKTILSALFISMSLINIAHAFTPEASPTGSIKRLIAYTKFGNGDVYVQLNANSTSCSHGYFIDKSSAGYESTLSMLLAAYQANTPVTLYANPEKKWAGSGNSVCELYSVVYSR
ncbi:hypothetical protein [Vibrio penaeicida]|uniref:hypothetical protein n=1 Tax=Vibrio penaeicida TaxID=104609 RepID=UPI000CEA1F3D|nr:hypothetical protein [Vibrio penaeicida]